MKKLQFCLALVALMLTANVNAKTAWNVSPTSGGGIVWAVLDTINNEIVLRIFGTGYMSDVDIVPDYTTMGPTVQYVAETPWKSEAASIRKVIVESGVTYIGKGAFYNCDNLRELHLPQTILELGDSCLSYDGFRDTIYCNAPIPPKGRTFDDPSTIPMFQNAFVKVPDDLVLAYCSTDNITNKQGDVYFNWWSHFHANVPSHIIGSNDAAAVCSTPQDSIKSNQFTINLELIGKDEADRRTYKYEITATGGSDNHHFWVIYDEEQDKWRVSEDGVKAPMRRKPILLRDTVRRTTETIQIDITNLTPATNYNYSVTGYNNVDDVVFQAQGSLLTSPAPLTGIENRVYEATTPKRYNLLGQLVDENYNGIIITEKGEKRLRK